MEVYAAAYEDCLATGWQHAGVLDVQEEQGLDQHFSPDAAKCFAHN